jgi:glutathione synthase
MRLSQFDAVLMRKDPPFDMEYIYSTYLLELAERQGAHIINRPRAVRDNNEKFSITRFSELTVPTLVTRLEAEIRAFLHAQRDIVLKPLDGMGGASVFRLHDQDANIGVVIETLTHYGRQTVMAQRYIPEIVKGDKRIIVIDGAPAPFALTRIPKPGETRAISLPAPAVSRKSCLLGTERLHKQWAKFLQPKVCYSSGSMLSATI